MTCASVVIDKRYGRLCRTHWYADKGRGRVESADEWSAFLIGLYEGQSRLCRTCGIFLVEGVNGNMSLDRITPKARGGEYTKSNVRWLCSTCNSMKNNMLDQELLNQCRRIVQCLG
jgi:5-methylcytosine-specific restriction endonuclease McrA